MRVELGGVSSEVSLTETETSVKGWLDAEFTALLVE